MGGTYRDLGECCLQYTPAADHYSTFQGSECSCRAVLICEVLQLRERAIKHSEKRKLCSRADLNFWLAL